MKTLLSLMAAVLLALPLAGEPVHAQSRDQQNAREEMKAGRNMSRREIERRIVPQMKGYEYLGFEYDGTVQAYRFKFIRDGKVVWVDVDPKTAQILRVQR